MRAADWQAWERGESRCPYCIDVEDMREFEAMCDCSRFSLETTGRPIVIQVTGMPETAQVVKPHTIVSPDRKEPA